MKKVIISLLAGTAIAASASAQTIADLDAHFANAQNDAFSFFWNPTGTTIGTAANYVALDGSTSTEFFMDATDPSNDFTNSNNDAQAADARLGLKFDATEARWMIGGQNAAGSTDGNDHFLIIAYTLQAGEAGNLQLNIDGSAGAGGTYVAYLNDTLIDTTSYAASGNKDNTYTVAGALEGDVVYFGWVGDSTQNRNTQRNFIQYTIEVVPEPSAYAMLAGLCALGFVMVRRRK